jgi:predicted nucleic acid-binding protein
MNVVDSSGWLEYYAGGENRAFFAPVIQQVDLLIVPTISMYEVFKRIVLLRTEEEALLAIAWMSTGRVIELTEKIALAAALLSIEHKLPMADSIILATARAFDATLWTQDEHFQGLAGVKYIAKPAGGG